MSKQSKSKPPLSPLDFERMFRVIHGALLNEEGDASKACLYFGIIGAAIIAKHHDASARPVVGAAVYNVCPANNYVLAFMQQDHLGIHSSTDDFHCWIEVGGWAVDLSSPMFPEMVQSTGKTTQIPRNLFQRSLNYMAESPYRTTAKNAFWYQPNPRLTVDLIHHFSSKLANVDIAEICVDWYEPAPGKIQPSLSIANQDGKISNMPLSPLRVEGAF